jgi:muramoyltetrapeptide carboxypeptidase
MGAPSCRSRRSAAFVGSARSRNPRGAAQAPAAFTDRASPRLDRTRPAGYPPRVIRPPPLRAGDVVRIVAPGSPFPQENLDAGLAVLRERFGLVPRFRADLTARARYLAGDDARRADEWREAVADPEARAILCVRGGYGAMRILPAIDPAPLRDRPKLVVGFSDVTAIHCALNRGGVATIHGPLVTTLGKLPEDALTHLERLLFGRAVRAGAWDAPGPGAGVVGTGTIRAGRATGPLLGGSLTMLAHLCGTPFAPDLAGAIVFIEDVGEKPYRLDRHLTHLRLAGRFDGIAGIAVGQLKDCDDPHGTGLDVVRAFVRTLGVPAIEGVPVGHEARNFAVPLGTRATLVGPGPSEEGPPRIVFDEPVTAAAAEVA